MLAMLLAAMFLFSACAGDPVVSDGNGEQTPNDNNTEPGGDENTDGNGNTNDGNTNGGNTNEENNPNNGENTNDPTATAPGFYLDGVEISKYSIVCEYPKEKTAMAEYWRDEYDSGKATAVRLAALIEEKFGVKLNSYYDTSRQPQQYEILVGNTNRNESKTAAINALTDDQYVVEMNNGKLVICGGAPGTTYHAVDNIEAYLNTTVENGHYEINAANPLSGSYHLQRIAILGDSISVGALATDYTTNKGMRGYAAQTGRMYWQECVVKSYAQAGICLRDDLSGFATSALWVNFRAEMKRNKFDTVLILLGTNDGYTDAKTGSTWDGVWTDEDDKSFYKSLEKMIQTIHIDNKQAEVVVMNCVAYYRSADPSSPDYRDSHYHSSPRVIALQGQVVTDLRAKGADYVHLYDMNTYSTEHTTKAMFSDLLHPDDQGHEILAKGVVAMLKLLREGKTDKYLVN